MASIVGTVVSVIGFPFVVRQLQVASRQRAEALRLTTAQTLLSLDAVIASYVAVSKELSANYQGPNSATPSDEQSITARAYVGLFERAFIAYSYGQVDVGTLRALYDYRLWNIWNSEKLVSEDLQNPDLKQHWSRFIALTYCLEVERGCRYPLHTDDYFPADLFKEQQGRGLLQRHQEIPADATDPFAWSYLNR